MKLYLHLFFLLAVGMSLQAQEGIIDSVVVKQIQSLNHLDGKYVLKIGTVFLDTPKNEEDQLLSVKDGIVISNGDRTIDVFHKVGSDDKIDLIPIAEEYANQGFSDIKIAFLTIENYQLKVVLEEETDDQYTITLGAFDGNVPLREFLKILSVKGVRGVWDKTNGKYTYIYGVYYSREKAKEAILKVLNDSMYADVLRYNKGLLANVSPAKLYNSTEIAAFRELQDEPVPMDTKSLVFRVQVGTYKGSVSIDRFKNVANVLVFPFGKDLNKCFSGSFSTYKEAYKHKLDLNAAGKGFKDAFIVAYRNGVRLSIGELVSKEQYQQIKTELGIK